MIANQTSPHPEGEPPSVEPDGVRLAGILGLIIVTTLAAAVGGWATTTSLASAVLAPGSVVVDNNVKKVQHQTGGVVGEILVREGDHVRPGQVLLRLDQTVARTNFQMVAKQLDELAVRKARLRAERDGAAGMELPARIADRQTEPELAEVIAGERSLFDNRALARAGQKAQLRQRIAQLREEVGGFEAQLEAKTKEIDLVVRELAGAQTLWRQNLMPITKLTALQREGARLEGEHGQLMAQKAQAGGKITEIELQTIQIDQDMRTEVTKDLREAQAKEAELVERRAAAEDQLKHIDIRAPQSGVAHQLAVHTVGGVIAPGEPIMLIVPEDDALVIEAKIAPQDIDHVRVGQKAFIRFPAFDMRTTPEFEGVVTRVAADLTKDQQTGGAFYVARLALKEDVRAAGASPQLDRLLPGMPAEAYIRTAERTALSYFLKPLRDQMARAFIEE